MRIFISIVVLAVSLIIALLSFFINVNQMDSYYKRMTYNSAENFASVLDPEFMLKLRQITQSEEYQKLQKTAEKSKDESLIENYLKEKGVWEEFSSVRKRMCNYMDNMDDIKYLYIMVLGDVNSLHDMYLVDDFDNPLYRTGDYDTREPELVGIDTSVKIEPTITTGKWGWLCSAYAPVCAKDGSIICHVGCDVDMEGVMSERLMHLLYLFISAIAVTAIALVVTILYIGKLFIKPLKKLTDESKKFTPKKDVTYEDAGVVRLYLDNQDEISDIYEVIRSMQISIIDYLNDMAKLEKANEDYLQSLRQAKSDIKDKKRKLGEMEKNTQHFMKNLQRAEEDIRTKEEQLGMMNKVVNHDALTHVGSKTAYVNKTEELAEMMAEGTAEFAIVMVDLNDLKKINDTYGHKSGDSYIKGCCRIICDTYKYSPIYRIGGDEFVVILTGQDYENRDELAYNIRSSFFEAFSNSVKPVFQRYSASIGMSVCTPEDSKYETVFKRADQEMYDEKMEFKKIYGSYR